jgi:hypothetical protein
MKTATTEIAVMVGLGVVFALIAATPSSAQFGMKAEVGYTSPYCMSIQGIPDELKRYCIREHERRLQLETDWFSESFSPFDRRDRASDRSFEIDSLAPTLPQ